MAQWRVLYDFAAEEDGELSVRAGDIVRALGAFGASRGGGPSGRRAPGMAPHPPHPLAMSSTSGLGGWAPALMRASRRPRYGDEAGLCPIAQPLRRFGARCESRHRTACSRLGRPTTGRNTALESCTRRPPTARSLARVVAPPAPPPPPPPRRRPQRREGRLDAGGGHFDGRQRLHPHGCVCVCARGVAWQEARVVTTPRRVEYRPPLDAARRELTTPPTPRLPAHTQSTRRPPTAAPPPPTRRPRRLPGPSMRPPPRRSLPRPPRLRRRCTRRCGRC